MKSMTIGLLVDLKLELAKYGFETDSRFSIVSDTDAAFVFTRSGKSRLLNIKSSAKEFLVSVLHNGHEAYSGTFTRPQNKMAELIISDYASYAGFEKISAPAPEQPVKADEPQEAPATPAEAEKPKEAKKSATKKKASTKKKVEKPAPKQDDDLEDMPDFEA